MESPYFQSILDTVARDERYHSELTSAMDEFQQFAGPIFETDRSYDARINSFHNWYILDRPLLGNGLTPLQYFLDYNANSLSVAESARFSELRDNVHSVFELVKFLKSRTRVRDLMTGLKYDIEDVEDTRFLDIGALFNSRLFVHERRFYFSNYFLLHPPEVGKRLRSEARKVRKAKEDPKSFLFRLVLYQSRWDQYAQMEVHNIYRFLAENAR